MLQDIKHRHVGKFLDLINNPINGENIKDEIVAFRAMKPQIIASIRRTHCVGLMNLL